MHPLDFEEFCWAFHEESKCDLLRNAFIGHSKISENVHEKLMDDFRLYFSLGGMPKVISLYQDTFFSPMRQRKERYPEAL